MDSTALNAAAVTDGSQAAVHDGTGKAGDEGANSLGPPLPTHENPASSSMNVGAETLATPAQIEPSSVTGTVAKDAVQASQQERLERPDGRQMQRPRQDQEDRAQEDAVPASQNDAARMEALGGQTVSPGDQIRREEEQAAQARRSQNAVSKADDTTAAASIGTASAALPHAQVGPIAGGQQATVPASVPTPADIRTAPALAETPTRMRTRVSSGVLRHKSVSEIISESPKNAPYNTPKQQQDTSSIVVSQKPTPLVKTRADAPVPPKLPHKSSPSRTPAEADRPLPLPAVSGGYAALKGAAEDPNRDYLETLFKIQAQDPPNGRSLGELLHKASKTVTTADQQAIVRERQDHRILKRIYGLQTNNHWSLRQMEPYAEPSAPKSHMDHLLAEMKWMRTDFRQERKSKTALAKYLARQCADWVNADAVERAEMRIRIKAAATPSSAVEGDDRRPSAEDNIPHSPAATSGGQGESHAHSEGSPPELEASKAEEASPATDDDVPATPQYATVPGSLFEAVNITEASQHLLDSEEFTKAINDLPLYTPFAENLETGAAQSLQRKIQTVPAVSKFCDGKIVAQMPAGPRKRSRYEYQDEDDDVVIGSEAKRARVSDEASGLAPEQTDVALFDPENKHIKDRLHANTAFRPPSEYAMPSTQFYEFRLASQWTWEDDQKLRRLAKEYSFNWSLITDDMTLSSDLHGAAERRTPWECFERWVELETLPNEMRKTVYFRTWAQRMDTATRNVDARYQTQLQHHAQNPNANPVQPPARRRTQPMRVEKRRSNRYLHLVDAMRKLARKREQQQHKQAEGKSLLTSQYAAGTDCEIAQKAASLRKQQENAQPKSTMHTPQEFSRLRHERDLQIAARQERYREQMLAQQKATQMQRTGQYTSQQQQAMVNGQQQRPGVPNPQQNQAGHVQAGSHAQLAATGQGMPHPQAPQQGVAINGRNGHLAAQHQMNMQGNVPQAQMQANMRGGATGPNQASNEAMQRMAMQAQYKHPQAQSQQYQMLQQQQQQHHQQQQQQQHLQPQQQQHQHLTPGSQHGQNGVLGNQMQTNQAMVAPMQVGHGHNSQSHASPMQHQAQPQQQQPHQQQQQQTPHVNGHTAASASPMPPPATPASQPQQLSSGHVPAINQIKHSLQAQHPQATPAQIDSMANEHMKRQVQAAQARQNAINAASGSHGVMSSAATGYNQNQTAFQQNQQTSANPQLNNYNTQAANLNGNGSSPQQQQYSALMRQRLMQQQAQLQTGNGTTNGSPQLTRASPSVVMQASPNMQQAVPNMNAMNGVSSSLPAGVVSNNAQRPPSRSATPQMARVSSSGGMSSPGVATQHSPRAGMVRQ